MSETMRKYLGETVAVKAAYQIDAARLAEFLGDTVVGYEGPLSLAQFEGGQSNPTYLLTTPRAKYVLRRRPPGVLLKSAHAVDREFRVMRALFEQGFPVPEPLVLCEDPDVLGTAFYIMRHVAGRVFLISAMPDLTPAERAAVYDSANETLARLHSLDHVALGLEDFGRSGNYFGRQVGRWSQQYESSKTDDIAEMDRLIDWLPRALPPEGETRLIHGDYSFHNLLIAPDKPQVAAVLDWELSTTGDPMGDLTYHAMEWYRPHDGDSRGTLVDYDLVALGIPSLDAYVARYCERVGRAAPENLGFYKAYNLFRVAAIVQGIVGRALAGNAAAEGASRQAARVRPLAEAAWAAALEAGAA
ncbi:phosphotransferase family protein [Phenylobacterium sp.]|jgi:aminoglycoside phosphotransferase (APT) family kinase protein|uniref:phosphotransferase family protein n=1 Tax=Phenylobacterium sp. TaxID=1871053 RepID=UPI002F3E28BA